MISALNSTYQEFVNNLNRVTQRMNTEQLDISSGVTMRNVSDNPDQVSSLLQARASLSASQQISTNLGTVTTEVNTGEQSLESAVQFFDQVQTAAAEGATGTQTATTRTSLAQQLQSIQQQMVSLANTNINGRYVFSGDQDQTAPYTYDPTLTNSVSAYQGTTFDPRRAGSQWNYLSNGPDRAADFRFERPHHQRILGHWGHDHGVEQQ